LLIIPPTGELHRTGTDRACQITVAQTSIMPVTVLIQRGQHGFSDPRSFVGLPASNQRNRCNRIVGKERSALQRT